VDKFYERKRRWYNTKQRPDDMLFRMKPILGSFQNRSLVERYPTISMVGIAIDIPVPKLLQPGLVNPMPARTPRI
jgi:hypothetical protein